MCNNTNCPFFCPICGDCSGNYTPDDDGKCYVRLGDCSFRGICEHPHKVVGKETPFIVNNECEWK